MSEAALVWCPFPDERSARDTIAALLDERLIACGNIVPGMSSLFVWQGQRETSDECGALLKTTAARLDAVMTRLAQLHPYDSPAIMGWRVCAGPQTLAWLHRETVAE